jgi:GC-rich sequence DNA-binding factor-like protein
MYNLPAAALAHILPQLRAALAAWQPLQQPTSWAAEYAAWRPLLESPNTQGAIFQDAANADDPYYALVSATVLPRLQQAISTGWQVR